MNIRLVMTKKEIILQTTLKLIAEQGIVATPMSQIQEESAVATGTIYHHFKSKEEIINFLYVREKMFFEEIANNNIDYTISYYDNFCAVVNAICDYYLEHNAIFHYFQQVVHSKYITSESKEKANAYLASIAQFIQHGIDTDELENNEVFLLLELLHSNVSIYIELVLKQQINDISSRQNLLNYTWKAIKK
jgi:AcrR family transcriptional regulator